MTAAGNACGIDRIRGVGKAAAETLAKLGIYTVYDLFSYYPSRYVDYEPRDLTEVRDGEQATIVGKVHSLPLLRFYAGKRSRLSVRVLSGRYLIAVIVFNRPYLKKKLKPGDTVTISGRWDARRSTMTAAEVRIGTIPAETTLAPVYPAAEQLPAGRMRKIIRQALKQFSDRIDENLPDTLRSRYKLMDKREAIQTIHFPADHRQLRLARRRLVYEEFLIHELKLQAHRQIERNNARGQRINYDEEAVVRLIDGLPFSLTAAQRRVLHEILEDMASDYAMNRLLQGDVGSGKTVVAAIALYASVTAGFQAALMAPTEILAAQHAAHIKQLLAPFSVRTALLTSGIRGKRRKALLEQLNQGEIQLLVGTHALIQKEVAFKRLGLVVTDEQHRFGVGQRRLLRVKGSDPDVLYMTATPIPRTLALSIYGDMDVSTIDELPKGRKTIKTFWVGHGRLPRVIRFMKSELEKGRQAYVICPLIEESDKLDVQNALDVHARMTEALTGFRIGLMHGRLSSEEKAEVMSSFKQNRIQVLVSTTVVEVGVDVPNATLMLIYDADRFGLAQLHQLRGRVGRGSGQSYCVLLADAGSESAKERMRLMTETTDGFKLSGYDLKLRGPGDFFGKNQSGLPEFRLADMVHDYRALAVARKDAACLVRDSAFWKEDDWRLLRRELERAGVLKHHRLD